jgi:nucleoside-diphosphate kinase
MQKTLILLKPEAIDRGLVGAILARFENANLRIENCRSCRPSLRHLEEHYAELKTRNEAAFRRTTRFLQDKPFIAVVIAGGNAIQKARALAGPTDPSAAAPGTIRGDFSSDTILSADAENRATCNLVHAADSEAAVVRETALWFA